MPGPNEQVTAVIERKSRSRLALDKLLEAFPHGDVAKIDGQPGNLTGAPEYQSNPGPWALVDFTDGQRFAIWKETGAIYRVGDFGAVEDDPWLTLDE
jgi:hypothetical protein